jgi:hypothetical protein
MALTSRKRDKLFLTYKETTAGTADTNAFLESHGLMDFPEPDYQHESNYGKLGTGEHGTKTELQAVWSPFSIKTQRFSEIAFLLSYFMGLDDFVSTITTGVYMHEILHLPVSSRVMPTFGLQYGPGTANAVMSGCVVNEFQLVFSKGGTSVVEATFTGFGNRHRINAGALAENATGSLSTGEVSTATEPLVNFKSTHLYMADTLESPFGITSISTTGHDLGSGESEITSILNSFTISGNNGMSAENFARAGGSGLINDWTRGDRRFTLEMNLRKDTSVADINSFILAGTQHALEFQFVGPFIAATAYRYSFHWFFPVMQFTKAPEDNESPISRAVASEIFEDANGNSMRAYAQSGVSHAYNTTKV